MSTNNIASQLLQGSRNIDRMREEIKQLVSMVLGSLRNDMVKHDPIIDVNWKFNFGDNEWQVTRVSGPLCHLKVLFVVWHGLKKDFIYTSDENFREPFSSDNVQRVHEGLSVLVTGILEQYPFAKDGLNHFFEAAKVTF